MLPFGGFPLREGAFLGSPIQVSTVRRLHAPTRGCIAACRALRRLSSRAILQTAWHVRVLVVSNRSDTIRGPDISSNWNSQAELVDRSLLAYTPNPSNPSFMGALVP